MVIRLETTNLQKIFGLGRKNRKTEQTSVGEKQPMLTVGSSFKPLNCNEMRGTGAQPAALDKRGRASYAGISWLLGL
jgi:hypothetical protein